MADPPTSSAGPKFRIVTSRSLGERPSGTASSPLPQELKPTPVMSSSSIHMQHPQSTQSLQAQPQVVIQTPQRPITPGAGRIVQMTQPQSSQSNTSQTLSAADRQSMVTKCVRFFKTLIQLSQQPEQQQPSQNPQQTAHLVKELVSTLVFGQMPAEEFTMRLQSALKSQAQPHLLPFLHKTLPYLRAAMRNGEVTIEGVVPPPTLMASTSQQIEATSPQQPIHIQMQPQQHIVSAQQQPSATTQHTHAQPIQVQVIPQQHHYSMHDPPAQVGLVEYTNSSVTAEPMNDNAAQRTDEEMVQVRQLQEGALDGTVLRPADIMSRITQYMNEMCYVDEEVLVVISDAVESRLRELIGELAVLAEHRIEPLRLNHNYAPIDDPRRQMRFLEDMDRQQEEQRENREKEALIRMSKSKGIAKDTIERAKEMQRADAEAKRNRDANAAAIAALSSGSKASRTKRDQTSGGGVSGTIQRPRTVRVNMRDFHVLIKKDSLFQRSQIVHKLALSGQHSESL